MVLNDLLPLIARSLYLNQKLFNGKMALNANDLDDYDECVNTLTMMNTKNYGNECK